MGAAELIRGVGATCALLLVLTLAVLPATEEPPILTSFRQELVGWVHSAEAGDLADLAAVDDAASLAQLVLTQRAVRVKREARRLSDTAPGAPSSLAELEGGAVANSSGAGHHSGKRQASEGVVALQTKTSMQSTQTKHGGAIPARFPEREPTQVQQDAPKWRAQHFLSDPSAREGKQIFYLHIWKCGGTNLCKIARTNGEASNNDWGCHAPDPVRPQGWKPCTDPKPFAQQHAELSFVGSECPLKGNEPFNDPKWLFVVVLRDPLTQATSWYLHARQVMKGKMPSFFEWVKAKKKARGIFFDQFEDNLQTRFICGWSCNEKPVLDEGDLEKAKANLAKFQVVLRLEEFNTNGPGMAPMSNILGWTAMDGGDHSVGTHRHVTATQTLTKFPNAGKYLQMELKWDYALYEYSKTLEQR